MMNAGLAAAPLLGQGAAQLAIAYGGDANAGVQSYGTAVGLTGAVGAAEVARQAVYAARVALHPERPQPAPSAVRAVGGMAVMAGAAAYGAGAAYNRSDAQGFGATVQALGVAAVEVTPQPVHTPRPSDDRGPVLPRHNQDVADFLRQQPAPSAASSSGQQQESQAASVTGRQSGSVQRRGR